ncbi:hypothetical protein GA0061098_1009194 [Bradyrhizobium shewense]|uniref:Uncharacterized protein n=1 Tax=Bradyrhizobium shewense TaxID=1761772 RepID=A0A1C3WS36_9BRAD|nr:hypothetical protein GA0061098_1009194 [Bradyrhizobium shewense]
MLVPSNICGVAILKWAVELSWTMKVNRLAVSAKSTVNPRQQERFGLDRAAWSHWTYNRGLCVGTS